ncbi:MAG: hypothetical protein QOJ42_4626 [Acidobacteriaceae bacterium]|jgi:hypothetical protein|nr:hypothetical protein [Acidobacteriaceae bacterium]
MSDEGGSFINDIVEHPAFERIRGEILSNLNDRAREAQQAFTGLMTFCGVIYTGATIAILGFYRVARCDRSSLPVNFRIRIIRCSAA